MTQRVNYTCPDCGRSYRDVVVPLKCRCKFAKPKPQHEACIHRGDIIERIVCRGCSGDREVDVYACGVHGRCHIATANDHRAGMSCRVCAAAGEGFEPEEKTENTPQ